MSSRTGMRTFGVAVIAVVLAVAATFGAVAAVRATDSPGFCRSACHEMAPYHTAWAAGSHAGVSCVECHVDPGTAARLSHKFVALGEVRTHIFGEPSFPSTTPVEVPNARCERCHETVADTKGFDHARHARGRDCTDCHADTGHKVTARALAQAGVLGDATPTAVTGAKALATTLSTQSVAATGHIDVSCSRCHDVARTACSVCHEPRHTSDAIPANISDCTGCHAPGSAWAFAHPVSTADCTACHTMPDGHVATSAVCTTCHKRTGESWAFSHPSRSANCTSCHSKPGGHVATSAGCLSCHRRAGESWAFSHPSASASCTSCHSRPAGHRSGSCASCHRTGASWAYTHSSSTRCSSCHRAPASHFGSTCASCHSPSRAWSSATFRHPRVPGGEHSYRSFACRSCHPGGYGSHSCTGCHDREGGDDDDD